ncbi:MAG TPA: hypothetical protein VF316_03835 [Polyangiaceae bacterium]
MLAILRLRTTLVLAAAIVGCNRAPAPTSPASGVQSTARPADSSTAPSGVPSIAGTVVLASTGLPPATGGVVYLEDAPKQPGVATSARIDVFHKEFTPFIAVITVGGAVSFGNRDALVHHFFSPDVPKWDTGLIQKDGSVAPRTFDSPGPIALLCNIHPEMLGYVLVIPSTYFGKLGAEGKYVMTDVPPGTYKATAWAPRMPTVTQSVTVGPSGAVTANFLLPPAPTPK